jgi:hypothetical protein
MAKAWLTPAIRRNTKTIAARLKIRRHRICLGLILTVKIPTWPIQLICIWTAVQSPIKRTAMIRICQYPTTPMTKAWVTRAITKNTKTITATLRTRKPRNFPGLMSIVKIPTWPIQLHCNTTMARFPTKRKAIPTPYQYRITRATRAKCLQ